MDIAAVDLGTSRAQRPRRAALAVMVLVAAVVVVGAPAAHAAALTSVNWSVSNNQVSATAVTYSYSFKTATTGTIKTITFAVSGAGLGGAPAIVKNYGIPAGTVARAGQTITYTVTTPVSVAASVPIYIEFSGLTNGTPAGGYTTSITTQTSVPATIDGPTTSNTVTLAANNTAVTVTLPRCSSPPCFIVSATARINSRSGHLLKRSSSNALALSGCFLRSTPGFWSDQSHPAVSQSALAKLIAFSRFETF